jgi:hypothetical protein
MGYVPADAKWFIAEIVEEITVEGDARNVVHVNFNLIRADSPEEAYTKSLELGKQGETEYNNSENKRVEIRFRGLRNLTVMYDELEHGAELMYEERVGVSPDELRKFISQKEQLDVFIPWKGPDFTKAPDYGAKEIIDEIERRFGLKRFEGMGESHGPDDH